MDGDGDLDFVAGNIGLNTRYTASADAPLRMYAKDFDAHAGAVLVQAYTLGMIVDDFVENQMDPEAWYDLIDKVVDKVFLVQG